MGHFSAEIAWYLDTKWVSDLSQNTKYVRAVTAIARLHYGNDCAIYIYTVWPKSQEHAWLNNWERWALGALDDDSTVTIYSYNNYIHTWYDDSVFTI